MIATHLVLILFGSFEVKFLTDLRCVYCSLIHGFGPGPWSFLFLLSCLFKPEKEFPCGDDIPRGVKLTRTLVPRNQVPKLKIYESGSFNSHQT